MYEICHCFDGLAHQLVSYIKKLSKCSSKIKNPESYSFFATKELKTLCQYVINGKLLSTNTDGLKLALAFDENMVRDKWVEVLRNVRSCLVHRGKYILNDDMTRIALMFPSADNNDDAIKQFINFTVLGLKTLNSFIQRIV